MLTYTPPAKMILILSAEGGNQKGGNSFLDLSPGDGRTHGPPVCEHRSVQQPQMGRDGARPLQGPEQDGGGVRLGCGFRQPNSETEFGASVIGIGLYAPRRGDEGRHAGASCPTGGCGEPPRLPWPAAHSGASAARSRGMGGNRSGDYPQRGHQPRAIPQSRLRRDSSLCTREPLGRGMRIAASLRFSQ